MKTAIVKFMSAVTFVLVVALNLAAQPVGQTVDSLEWRCARSSAIVRGVVKDFRVPDDQVDEPYTPEWEFTVSVSETIKGPGQKEIVFRHAYDRRVVADLEKIKGNKTSFLLFLDKSEKPKLIRESYPGTFPVPNPQAATDSETFPSDEDSAGLEATNVPQPLSAGLIIAIQHQTNCR